MGLCNVTYKMITKILASRLKECMPKLISQTQSSFVPGRQNSDNILVVQEVIHTMRSKKGQTRVMAIKIDFKKAYDRLNWKFIPKTLEDVGLLSIFIKLVHEYISTANMSLLQTF